MKKSLIAIIAGLLGGIIGGVAVGIATVRFLGKEVKKCKELSDKHFVLMRLFEQWIFTKQEGKSVVDYLKEKNIKSVAIYGMSYVGNRLYDELEGTDISVKYVIDRKGDSCYVEVDVFKPEDELMPVDAVLVTAVYYFDEIEEALSEKLDCPILSLEDILYEM